MKQQLQMVDGQALIANPSLLLVMPEIRIFRLHYVWHLHPAYQR